MQTLRQDLRYAARMLAKHRGFTAAAVVTLALGIGANTIVFSLIHTLFTRPLPVPRADQLVHVWRVQDERRELNQFSFPDYLYVREHAMVFSDLAAHYSTAPISFGIGAQASEINGNVVTANYFGLLELQPALGRFFVRDDDAVPGRNPVAVISHDFWRQQFKGDPLIIGKPIALNGTQFTIVGVAPQGFRGVFYGGLSAEVWMPSAMFKVGYRYCDALADRDCRLVGIIGRLNRGRTLTEARTELTVLSGQLETAFPAVDKGLGVAIAPARGLGIPSEFVGERAQTPRLLGMAVALVLLIACANVAGLLLARGLSRRREIAIRLAIGASRARLLRQLITESLLLAVAGGSAGLVAAVWGKDLVGLFYMVNEEGQRAYFNLDPDPTVLAFTLGASVLAAILFGLLPAFRASRPDVLSSLRIEGTGVTARSRLRDVLVVGQVGLSVVLLVGAGVLTRSLTSVYRGPGFDPRPILVLRLRPSLIAQTPARAQAFQTNVIRRLESVPGVVAVSPAAFPPLPGWDGSFMPVRLPTEPEPARRADEFRVAYNLVGPHYLATLGVSLLAGRDFDSHDVKGTAAVVIVNDALARHFWPDGSALARTLMLRNRPYTIVGIAPNVQFVRTGEAQRPLVYANFWQTGSIDTEPVDSRTHVRVIGDPRVMLARVRQEIAAVDPTVPITEDRPLTEWLDYTMLSMRAATAMLKGFSVLALFLSAIGLYGVLAFTVRQRTRDIAIRKALGAKTRDLARMVLAHGATLALTGIAIGLAGAFASARLMRSMLYGVAEHDLLTMIVMPSLLLVVALAASYLPARRATRVDPMVALRYE